MTPQEGEQVFHILHRRDGKLSNVSLADGTTCIVWNIAWGRDLGEEFDHITANCSPFVSDNGEPADTPEAPMHFFLTSQVSAILDEWGNELFRVSRSPYR